MPDKTETTTPVDVELLDEMHEFIRTVSNLDQVTKVSWRRALLTRYKNYRGIKEWPERLSS